MALKGLTNLGSADDENLYESARHLDAYDQHAISCVAGAVTIEVLLRPGGTWRQVGTSVAAGSMSTLNQNVHKLRILQDGATNSQAEYRHVQTMGR